MKRWAVAAVLSLAAVPVAAQDGVVAARAQGLVGERYDGYLGVVGTVNPEVRSQVAAINIKRRALFADLAARHGVSAQDVGVTAACALLGRVAVGEAYALTDEQWRRRGPGQAAPRPNYC